MEVLDESIMSLPLYGGFSTLSREERCSMLSTAQQSKVDRVNERSPPLHGVGSVHSQEERCDITEQVK